MVKKMIINEFLRTNVKRYIAGLIALVSSSALALAIPKLLGYITDGLNGRSLGVPEVWRLSLYMLLMAVLLFLMKFTFRIILIGKSRDLECFLRGRLFAQLQGLPPKFYNEKKTGDLMAYVINDLGAIRMAFAIGLVFLVDGFLLNAFSVVIMANTINVKLTLIAVAPVVISILIVFWLRKKIREKFTVVQETFADLSGKIQENISGIRVVKAYVQEDLEIAKLEKASRKRYKAQMDYVKLSAMLNPVIQLNFGISFVLVIVIGSMYVKDGTISLGDFITMNTYLTMLIMPLMQLSRTVEIWQKAFASMKRLDDIFVEKPDVTDNGANQSITRLKGGVRFKNLSFTYPSPNIYPSPNQSTLTNINIEIMQGKTLGIIGTTGSGKTTLANILLHLYKIEKNSLYIDGRDINEIPLKTLRESIGFVPQDNFLFATSIMDNIKFFDSAITDEAAVEAAKLACVYDSIMEFPEQFNTIVGERGITLSGGQKQRISIARALVKNPRILVLDDSLSAVDTNTEEEIIANIRQILAGRTGIIIAHRISTIKNADEIIYMDGGRIMERGTHDELLALGGEYCRLNRGQSLEGEMEVHE